MEKACNVAESRQSAGKNASLDNCQKLSDGKVLSGIELTRTGRCHATGKLSLRLEHKQRKIIPSGLT